MSKRRTHCPAGRPIHRFGDLPADRLATRTMLARRRRRPADGQEPVASYWTGHEYVPLYEIASTVELPPLTGKRAEAYAWARLCARCPAVSDEGPHRATADGRRLCGGCHVAEAKVEWAVRHNRDRPLSVAWAAEVLADERTVLVAASKPGKWDRTFDVAAITAAGDEVVSVQLRPRTIADRTDLGGVTIAELHDSGVLDRLADSRLIGWNYGALYDVDRDWAAHRGDWNRFRLPINPDRDWFSEQYGRWIGDRAGSWGTAAYVSGWYAHPLQPEAEPRVLVEEVRKRLQRMAADDHPAGPPSCPVLPPTGLEPCGAVLGPLGVCADHEPPAAAAEVP